MYIKSKYVHSNTGDDLKNQYITYAFNFITFSAITFVQTQMIPYLTSIGYNVIQRGYILAMNAVVAIIGQFLAGYLCDKFKRMKIIFFVFYFVLLFSSIAMLLQDKNIFYYHFITVSLSGGLVKVIMGLEETWMLALNEKQYGICRAWGALGLSVTSVITGIIVKNYDYQILLLLFCITSVFLLIIMLFVKDVKNKNNEKITFKSLKECFANKKYIILVSIYLLIYMIGTADQYVVIEKMQDLNAGSTYIGIKWALQSFMEIPLFLYAVKILKKWKPYSLLLFGIIMYGIKFIFYALSFHPILIILTTILQIVTLPIIMLTSKVLVNDITPEKLSSSAQMIAMAIFIGFSGLFTPVITSYLSKSFGYNSTLWIVAFFSIVPFLLALYYRKIKDLS